MAKERAKQNPFFRTYICMPPAQCKLYIIVLHNNMGGDMMDT